MKPLLRLLLLIALAAPYPFEAAWAANTVQVEFLWSSIPNGALARAEAYGFVLEGNQDHLVCVIALSQESEAMPLRVDVIDASGALISSQIHDDFAGPKECYTAELGASEAVGEWTFNVYMNHKLAATKTIEVARTLKDASFYAQPARPYVLGRPNYDPTIPADDYRAPRITAFFARDGGASRPDGHSLSQTTPHRWVGGDFFTTRTAFRRPRRSCGHHSPVV